MKAYMEDMQQKVSTRLRLLYQGIMDMKDREASCGCDSTSRCSYTLVFTLD